MTRGVTRGSPRRPGPSRWTDRTTQTNASSRDARSCRRSSPTRRRRRLWTFSPSALGKSSTSSPHRIGWTTEAKVSPRGAVASSGRLRVLLCLYEKLGKDDVAAGPGNSVDKFNAHCAKHLVSELDGAGVTAVAIADATNAWNAWKARRDYEAAQPRAMDDEDGSVDPEPERISKADKSRARLAAFRAYAALVTRTQTKVKFYQAMFEPRGGAEEMSKRWNSLLEPSYRPRLEVEARLVSARASDGREPRRQPGATAPLSRTRRCRSRYRPRSPRGRDSRGSAREPHRALKTRPRTKNGTGKTGKTPALHDEDDEGPLDELETHPLASSVFAALEHLTRGGVTDFDDAHETPKLVGSLRTLLSDRAVDHAPRLLVAKALLRLHRKEIDAFQRATIAAEEERSRRARDGPDDSQEIEVLAERSPEELEAERIERAKREGNYFNLADSQGCQGETTTTTTARRCPRNRRRRRRGRRLTRTHS